MKRALTILSILSLIAINHSAKADSATYFVNSKEVTKLEAFKASINKEPVMKCNQVSLSDKLTFKNIKSKK